MISNRPYLLRAFYQWIVDSACTPILVLDATNPQCKIPRDFSEGGEIVFNISSSAVRDLKLLNDWVEFKASFSGVIHIISAPIKGVLAVYAEENGEGIFFDAEDGEEATPEAIPVTLKEVDSMGASHEHLSSETAFDRAIPPVKGKPFLTLVE